MKRLPRCRRCGKFIPKRIRYVSDYCTYRCAYPTLYPPKPKEPQR